MQTAAVKGPAKSFCRSKCRPQSAQRFSHVVRATKATGSDGIIQVAKLPLAAMCAAALLTGAMMPEEALAARSGGRVGGSSFSSRRAAPTAPSRSAATGPTTRNYNYYSAPVVVAPPLVGGFGFPGFGFPGMGFGYGSAIVFPGFGLISSLFSLFFLVITLSFIVNVVKGIFDSKKYDD